ncbi:hypothetical protein Patl1_19309 [Pistacia atlantica]|uniref:Uncharacterized protein n=1 Tax=Pistacia atlantica TaxID=434234 RepID=A0ACC1C0K7_9ROSI|nr:hypothetical protein Patl1_19309 [Pistacia atlantica]
MNSSMALQTHVSALNSSKCFPPSTANPPSKIFVHDFFASPSNIVKHSANSLQASRRLQPCLASNNNQEAYRPVANFAPTIWKDSNIFNSVLPHSEIESNDKLAEELKQRVKEILIASTSDPAEKVCLIDSICRLGVSYHFETEIEEQLNEIFEAQPNLAEDNDYDLYTIALLFRVSRQHGFKMSCGVFDKFKDSNGTFKENIAGDARGILSLYEATHLRVRGEDILKEALDFTTTHLKSLAKSSPDHLAKHITSALEAPLHKNVPRLETHKYISFYQEVLGEYRNETLLIFAKLDFNRLKEYVRACLEEAKWFNEGFVPSFNQRLSNAIITVGTGFVIAASFVGMGETARINEFEWLQNHPKIVEAVFTIGRLKTDIKAHEFEQKRGHVSSTVGCYMKQYGISKEETVEKFEKILIANAWKDINEEYMKQTDVSRNILVTVVNFARLAEILYKNQDGFTFPEDLKDYIIKLFVDPIPV